MYLLDRKHVAGAAVRSQALGNSQKSAGPHGGRPAISIERSLWINAPIEDVFDALTHPRCYKDAWPLHQALDYIVEQSGRRFDPALVELFMQNLDQFLEIHERLRDPPGGMH